MAKRGTSQCPKCSVYVGNKGFKRHVRVCDGDVAKVLRRLSYGRAHRAKLMERAREVAGGASETVVKRPRKAKATTQWKYCPYCAGPLS